MLRRVEWKSEPRLNKEEVFSAMKTAISLPDRLFEEAEAAARDLGVSRSRLVRIALEAYLERRREEDLTAEINRNIEKYGDPSDGEEALLEHSRQLVAGLEKDE